MEVLIYDIRKIVLGRNDYSYYYNVYKIWIEAINYVP